MPKKKAKAYVGVRGRRKEASYYALVSYEGAAPTSPAHFLDLAIDGLEDGHFGPTTHLQVRELGKLIARAWVPTYHDAPSLKNKKGYWQDLYRIRVYGPEPEIKVIRANLTAEYGRLDGRIISPARLRELGWTPVDEDGKLILPRGKVKV